MKKRGNGPIVDMTTFWSAGSIVAVLVATVYGTWWVREKPEPIDKRSLKKEERF